MFRFGGRLTRVRLKLKEKEKRFCRSQEKMYIGFP